MPGIVSFGGYIPRYRLNRLSIFKAMGWINQATAAYARGEKPVANFDEDSLTMAVAAGLDCLNGIDRSLVDGAYLASTTMAYKERLNAGILAAGMGLGEHIRAADFGGGLKAATTALLSALEGVESGRLDRVVVAAADSRLGAPGSAQEMIFGDASAAVMVGRENVIAEFKGSYSTTYDFVDHYRGAYARFDRQWEDRWIRDLGFEFIIPETVKGLLCKYGMDMADFSKVIYPCYYGAERRKLNKVLGLGPETEQSPLMEDIGDAGSAQPMIMLVNALENAAPGDKILVLSFGGGCDALVFEVTENIRDLDKPKGISGHLAAKVELERYEKYLVWRGILPADQGIRAEEDTWTRWSFQWRNRKSIYGLWGSKCGRCGTVHYPPQKICTNPDCGAIEEMEDFLLSDKRGRIVAYTGDNLAPSNDPPAVYGTIEFETGGRYMFDLTDCDLESLAVGMPVSMSFRRKYYDEKRDISAYFWKGVPIKEEK